MEISLASCRKMMRGGSRPSRSSASSGQPSRMTCSDVLPQSWMRNVPPLRLSAGSLFASFTSRRTTLQMPSNAMSRWHPARSFTQLGGSFTTMLSVFLRTADSVTHACSNGTVLVWPERVAHGGGDERTIAERPAPPGHLLNATAACPARGKLPKPRRIGRKTAVLRARSSTTRHQLGCRRIGVRPLKLKLASRLSASVLVCLGLHTVGADAPYASLRGRRRVDVFLHWSHPPHIAVRGLECSTARLRSSALSASTTKDGTPLWTGRASTSMRN